MTERSMPLWARDGLYVDVSVRDSGELVFDAQHLRNGGEYEYALTVRPDQVPIVVAALGGEAGADVLGLLRAHAEDIIRRGEKSWLESIGVTPGFWSHGDWWELFDD